MIRIAITPAAYCGHRRTLALGTVAVESERAEDGSVHIWLDPGVLAKLKALRGPGESYSDVIVRLARARGRANPARQTKAPARERRGLTEDTTANPKFAELFALRIFGVRAAQQACDHFRGGVSVRGSHIGADSIERGFQNLLRRVEGENIRLDEFFQQGCSDQTASQTAGVDLLGRIDHSQNSNGVEDP
jgi:hypothetical protein